MKPRQFVQAWTDAFNRAEVEALMAFHPEGATKHHLVASPERGCEAIGRMFASGFASPTMVSIVENG